MKYSIHTGDVKIGAVISCMLHKLMLLSVDDLLLTSIGSNGRIGIFMRFKIASLNTSIYGTNCH